MACHKNVLTIRSVRFSHCYVIMYSMAAMQFVLNWYQHQNRRLREYLGLVISYEIYDKSH